jgi:hypothetical protein
MVPAVSPEVIGITDSAIPASHRPWRRYAVDFSGDSATEFPLD